MNAATLENLRRKATVIDPVQMHNGKPMFSWIDLNPTELCNRKCVFCPRVDENQYPNQRLHMSHGLARKIGDELRKLNYKGTVVMCGFGEPLLHPKLADLCSLFSCRVEIVTNGDPLTVAMAKDLHQGGVDFFAVSLYDGPEQAEPIKAIFAEAGVPRENYILRDRWHNAEKEFGLKLTNRAGTVSVGTQAPVDVTHSCFYPAYEFTIDWNGDVLLCVQDWNKRVRFGNVSQQGLWEVWTSKAMHKRRMQLIRGDRCQAPCSGCNANGTLHGDGHAKEWQMNRPPE